MDNTVTIIGNVTRDPELRFTASGVAVASLSVAVNRKWTSKTTGQTEEQTSFLDVSCWSSLAENVAESVAKGSRVIVTGRLEQDSWEKDGEKRTKVKIVADDIGPSLRWNTAVTTKTEREGPRQAPPADDGSPF